MRILMIGAALIALGGCNRGSGNNGAANAAAGNGGAAANQMTPPANAANASAAPAAPAADAELAAIEKTNAQEATAAARAVSTERDADARAATCVVFLGISRGANSRDVGFDDAAMRQAQDQWKADLRQRMSQQEVDQLTGSSVNMLTPAEAGARDAASAWCVRNAPEVDPER